MLVPILVTWVRDFHSAIIHWLHVNIPDPLWWWLLMELFPSVYWSWLLNVQSAIIFAPGAIFSSFLSNPVSSVRLDICTAPLYINSSSYLIPFWILYMEFLHIRIALCWSNVHGTTIFASAPISHNFDTLTAPLSIGCTHPFGIPFWSVFWKSYPCPFMYHDGWLHAALLYSCLTLANHHYCYSLS